MKRPASSLIFVIISIAVIGALVGTLYLKLGNSLDSVERAQAKESAYQLAQAGIDLATHNLSYNPAYNGQENYSLAPMAGVVDIVITSPTEETKLVTSTGYYPSKTLTIAKKILTQSLIGNDDIIGNAFVYAVQSGSGGFYSAANRNPKIQGSIYSNEKVQILGNGSKVTGDIWSVGSTTANGTVSGTIHQGVTSKPTPEVDIESWKNLASQGLTQHGDYVISTNGSFTLGGEGNVSVIEGQLIISSNATITLAGPIWVKGRAGKSIDLSGNAVLSISSNLTTNKIAIIADQLISITGNANFTTNKPGAWVLLLGLAPGSLSPDSSAIEIDANAKFDAAIVYAYYGQLWFQNNTSGVNGKAFVGQKIKISSNLTLIYNTGLGLINFNQVGTSPTGGGFKPVTGGYGETTI